MTIIILPNTLTNGTTADADEVQANDAALLAGVNNIESDQIVDGTIVNADLNVSVQPVIRYTEAGGKNFVVDASTWIIATTSGDLNYTIPTFTSYVGGVRNVTSSSARLYTASRDIYVDKDNLGVLSYNEVLNGAGAPAQAAGTLRLLKVVTDGTTVTDVVTLTRDSALDTTVQAEMRKIDANLSYNTASSEVPGNQEVTLIFRGRDSTGNFILDTGTTGVTLDSAIKQLVNGMDQNIALTAATPIHVYCIGAQDGSAPVGGLLSYESDEYGTGIPILPVGYDIFKWVGTLMTTPTPALFIPSTQTDLETLFYEHIKNVFLPGNNSMWTVYTFDPLYALKDDVGEVLIRGALDNGPQIGYANFSVTGATIPESQPGAVTLGIARAGTFAIGSGWVPLNELGQANIYHNAVTSGTANSQQGGRVLPNGAGIFGWKYKHK